MNLHCRSLKLNAARAEAKGKAEWKAEGKAEGMTEGICQYLQARFGVESQAIQETVRVITHLDALSRITNRIFVVTSLDEATTLIQGNLVSQ